MRVPAASSEAITLCAETARLIRASFDAYSPPHQPSDEMWAGIEDLSLCLARMAEGEAEPSFFMSSLDPGVGKTQTVVHFLRALRGSERHRDVGVIVFFFTKKQIEDIIKDAGLRKQDFAVLVSDEESAEYKLGSLGSDHPHTAPVLFTTQQRLQLVCRDRPFTEVSQYFFRGQPRGVRIWDESLLPAQQVCVNAASIGALYPILNNIRPELIGELDRLRAMLRDCSDHSVIRVPDLGAAVGLSLSRLQAAMPMKRPETVKIATDLWSLYGRNAVVRDDGKKGATLVSIRESVPADLAPMAVLDASARVRTAYDWWPNSFVKLEHLRIAPKRYNHLICRVWSIGSGQAAYDDDEDRQLRCNGILRAINSRPKERWLVICHKRHRENIEKEIAALIEGDSQRVEYIHWGIHRASNGYAEIRNIVLAGLPYLSASGYEGVGRAARRCHPDDCALDETTLIKLKQGELADAVLQAVCRGIPRIAVNGGCWPSEVYILASAQSRLREKLPDIFPGCSVEAWEPEARRLREKDRAAVDYIREWCLAHPDAALPSKAVMEYIGEKDRHNFARRRRRPAFRRALSDHDIYETVYGAKGVAFVHRPTEDAPGLSAADYGFTEEPSEANESGAAHAPREGAQDSI